MSKYIAPFLILTMLFACSGKESQKQSTPEVMETALGKQDCLDLKAQHDQLMKKTTFKVLDRVNGTAKPIHMLPPPPKEELIVGSESMPTQARIYPGESLEDFNQRMQQDAEDRTKQQAEKKQQLQNEYEAEAKEYGMKITALKQKVDACFAQL